MTSTLLPADGSAPSIYEELTMLARTLPSGSSKVRFKPGNAALWNSSALRTVAVLLIDVDSRICQETYAYLHHVQTLGQRLRPLIITDDSDLRTIRRYGWLTEHVFDRPSYESLVTDEAWRDMIMRRVSTSATHHDACLAIPVDPKGITVDLHTSLMSRTNQDIPFAAVRPASRQLETDSARVV